MLRRRRLRSHESLLVVLIVPTSRTAGSRRVPRPVLVLGNATQRQETAGHKTQPYFKEKRKKQIENMDY
jgi:hypothetical protein